MNQEIITRNSLDRPPHFVAERITPRNRVDRRKAAQTTAFRMVLINLLMFALGFLFSLPWLFTHEDIITNLSTFLGW